MSSLVRSFASLYCQKPRCATRLGHDNLPAAARFPAFDPRRSSFSASGTRRGASEEHVARLAIGSRLVIATPFLHSRWASFLQIPSEVEMVKESKPSRHPRHRFKRSAGRRAAPSAAAAAAISVNSSSQEAVCGNKYLFGGGSGGGDDGGGEELQQSQVSQDSRNVCGIPWNWSRIHHRGKSFLDMASRSLSCGLSDPK